MLHDTGYLRRASQSHVANGAVFTGARQPPAPSSPPRTCRRSASAPRPRSRAAGAFHRLRNGPRRDPGRGRTSACSMDGRHRGPHRTDVDRMYLEKCRDFLYAEFVWANIARGGSPTATSWCATPRRRISCEDAGFYEHVARARIESSAAQTASPRPISTARTRTSRRSSATSPSCGSSSRRPSSGACAGSATRSRLGQLRDQPARCPHESRVEAPAPDELSPER